MIVDIGGNSSREQYYRLAICISNRDPPEVQEFSHILPLQKTPSHLDPGVPTRLMLYKASIRGQEVSLWPASIIVATALCGWSKNPWRPGQWAFHNKRRLGAIVFGTSGNKSPWDILINLIVVFSRDECSKTVSSGDKQDKALKGDRLYFCTWGGASQVPKYFFQNIFAPGSSISVS